MDLFIEMYQSAVNGQPRSQYTSSSVISRQMNELPQLLTKRQHDWGRCQKHDLKLVYFCKNCKMAVCADCGMLQNQHRGHDYDRLSSVVSRYQQQLKAHLMVLSNKKKSFTQSLFKIQQQIAKTSHLKNDKNAELQKFTANLDERIERKYGLALGVLEKQQEALQAKLADMTDLHENIVKKLNSYSKPKLLYEEQNLINQIGKWPQDIVEVDIPNLQYSLPSELVPSYQSKTYVIPNYTEARRKKEVIYTDIMVAQNLQWRLKIYPNGNQTSDSTYISIFVELYKGVQQMGKYKYKVQIVNQKNPGVKISREFDSEFQNGECWGYNTYAKIATLYEQGYVHPTSDYLEILLHIKSPSYFHRVLDQNRVLEDKRRKMISNSARIRQLKEALNIKCSPLASQKKAVHKPPVEQLIDLDQICEADACQTVEDSPRIKDEEIYSPIIKITEDLMGLDTELKLDQIKSIRSTKVRSSNHVSH